VQQARVSKSVGAIVLNNAFQTLLIFQRKNTYWEFPKGKMEPGEREIDTLQREIFEETGIRKFRMVKDFRKVMYYDFRYKGQRIRRKVVYFLLKTSDKVKISEEHSEYIWLPLERAKSRLKHKNQIALIDEVMKRVYG
jgi:8-oxo-dGTP pyrophosphatase MutT (NUDIX family)